MIDVGLLSVIRRHRDKLPIREITRRTGLSRNTITKYLANGLRAYLTQTHELLFDAHNHAFRVLDGIPEHGIYDNMKTAVDKVGRGKHRKVNARFRAMVNHFLFESGFCNPAAGWEKGQVEKAAPLPRYSTMSVLR